jgi:uncharacterized NAD(P)/FAD-binding protein YdhS
VLLIGSGLTMVDIALALDGQGHTGQIIALSRHGLLPARHAFGGQWPAFIGPLLPASPASLVRVLRDQISQAQEQGVPWQRVIDAVRPFVARIWRGWSVSQKRAFLRHLRTRWDVLRHRMAPRIAGRIDRLVAQGRLKFVSARLTSCKSSDAGVILDVSHGSGRSETIHARHVINCTGPRSDFGVVGIPLIADARRRGLIRPDAIGLGIETDSCAVIPENGAPSHWLFAIGALTRPAWWEITAAPEITAQVMAFANSLSVQPQTAQPLEDRFQDLGAGI